MKFQISPLAEEDLAESIEFFGKKMLDLEFEFILEFESAIEKIKQNPNTYPIKHSYKGIDV